MSAEMYDFSLFENTKVAGVDVGNAAPKIEEKQDAPELIAFKGNKAYFASRRKNKLRVAAILSGFILLVGAIGFQISSFAAIYETDKAIAQKEAAIAVAKSEQVRLSAELDAKNSIENIDFYAENILGMKKPESFQVNYICLAEADEVLLSGGQAYEEQKTGLFANITKYFSSLES